MPVDNEAITFIGDPESRLAIWPGLDGFCEITIADSDYPEGLPGLIELKTEFESLMEVLNGTPLEISNGEGMLWLERVDDRIKLSFSEADEEAVEYGSVRADDFRELVSTAGRSLT